MSAGASERGRVAARRLKHAQYLACRSFCQLLFIGRKLFTRMRGVWAPTPPFVVDFMVRQTYASVGTRERGTVVAQRQKITQYAA